MRLRENEYRLSSTEWDRLIEAMRCFDKEKDLPRDWNWYVDTHKEFGKHDHETMPHVPGSSEHIHIHSPYYWLAWHRLFLLNFENRLRRYDANVTLPFWRFTVQREIPENLKKKVFGWMGVSRAVRHNPDNLPSVEDMQAVRNATSYSAFDGGLSSLHGQVHNWVGGDWGAMSNAKKSAKDPLFYLLHAYIDMIWADWQEQNPTIEFPEDYLDLELVPWDSKVRDVLDVRALDYGYA